MSLPPLLILDPCNFLPFYNINLGAALCRQGWKVEWITSAFPFENIRIPNSINVNTAFYSRHFLSALLNYKSIRGSPIRGMIKGLTYPFEMMSFHSRFRHRSPGIIHVQWSNLPWSDILMWTWWQRQGWRIIYTAHDVVPLRGTTPRFFSLANARLFGQADAVVVHSEYARRKILKFGIAPRKIARIPLSLSHNNGHRKLDQAAACRKLGIPEDKPKILFFGFIKPYHCCPIKN